MIYVNVSEVIEASTLVNKQSVKYIYHKFNIHDMKYMLVSIYQCIPASLGGYVVTKNTLKKVHSFTPI